MDSTSVEIQDEFRIAPGDVRGSVEILKEGRMFMNSLSGGEIPCGDMGGLGLFYSDTRFLSCLELDLNDSDPIFLSRSLRDSHFAQIELTNKEFHVDGHLFPMQSVHIRLLRMLKEGLYQRARIINFNQSPVKLNLKIKLGADFADIFEVRGTPRTVKGAMEAPEIHKNKATLKYLGLDGLFRSTEFHFHPEPDNIYDQDSHIYVEYNLLLEPKKKYYLYLRIVPAIGNKSRKTGNKQTDLGFSRAADYLIESYKKWKDECLKISSDNDRFNYLTKVAVTDLRALSTAYPGVGTVLEAGIPWYAAPFGRDSMITAWQALMVNSDLARETLRFMAKYQGQEINSWRDEEPGKILHEIRFGEMAENGEVPHTPYYGSVDSTLWFIILLGEYVKWTGDNNFFRKMSGPLSKALKWCEEYGDMDKDGFIEYHCHSEKGLLNQGWKDSWDGVIDRKGNIPEGPIALVEVQGYYYKALRVAASLYEQNGEWTKGHELEEKANKLQQKFLQDFWSERSGLLAFALDGKKNALRTVVSNPGHCLFTGILPRKKSLRLVERLMKPDMYSGWGIRTMSDKEVAYNPMSYHNGTVWPHDNAIIGYGMRQVGSFEYLKTLVDDLFEAALHFTHFRLPELFCGFTRRGKAGPAQYPIACDPQAWSVGTFFLLLRAVLGIKCRGNEIYITDPHLPEFLNTLRLENMRVGTGVASLDFTRRQDKTYCSVVGTKGNVKVIIAKEV